MSNLEEGKRWLNQGERDLGAAIVLIVKKIIPEFRDLGRASTELDKHYIPPRYPDAFPSGSPFEYYTREDADKCIKYAESILAEVRNYLTK
ncbi:MAG: HEPN domain-containing protein [Candidatus Methanoperedens sp.]|jgi:HEPN domain-containing protein|nr:HEPN domain-containing protein [Candidatus Methanoperedens sp.]